MIAQAVIAAGGLGTRMANFSPGIPKVLNRVGSKTLLEHTMNCLSENGIRRIHLLLGVFSDQILEMISAIKGQYSLEIDFTIEPEALGTGGSLLNILSKLEEEFIYLYGDLLINTDLIEIGNTLDNPEIDCVQLVHPTDHAFDSDLLILNDQSMVCDYLLKPHQPKAIFHNVANSGVYGFKKSALMTIPNFKIGQKCDLDKEILPTLVTNGMRIKAVRNLGYVRDAGTPERIQLVESDYDSRKFGARTRPAIFLDRDGTLNEPAGYISKLDSFRIYPDVGPFVRRANQSGYRVFVITNQPVIARGEATKADIDMIHAKLETEVSRSGGFFDAIYYCPHHPDKGYRGERLEYKIVCECRKPKVGLIEEATRKFPINLSQSVFIGDSDVDAICAANARLSFIRLNRGEDKSELNTIKSLNDIEFSEYKIKFKSQF